MAQAPARRSRLVLVGVVALVLVLLGAGYWVFVARTSDSPAPVALDATPAPSTTSTGATTGSGTGTGSADGTWQVRRDGSSYVGYRVREQLTFLSSPNDAVGRSTAVTGTMQLADDQVSAVRIEADLTKLTSDESRRDNAIRQRGLESERFPTATFELTQPIRLDRPPVDGQQVTGEGRGRLTVHGVTRDVTLRLQARRDGQAIQVAGQLPVRMTDYGIEPPKFGPVVSIQDDVTVEFRLIFEPA
jgi:polyisoprenoid-binding protein YceI